VRQSISRLEHPPEEFLRWLPLLEGDAFLRHWSISKAMSQRDRDAHASKLVKRMYAENDRDLLNTLTTVLTRIGAGVSP
jgi:hypothetical protein